MTKENDQRNRAYADGSETDQGLFPPEKDGE